MAYPTVSAPYGLVPVNLIGGQVYSGATRDMPIANAYATNIFNGDVVKRINDGSVEKDTGTTTATPVGVFMGCSYTNADGEYVHRNYWPASTVSTDAVAHIADDPDQLFKVAIVSGTTVIAGYAVTIVGNNAELVQNAGVTLSGKSQVAIDGSSVATTLSFPMRIIDVVGETTDSSGNYTECIVKWNEPYLAEGTPNTTTGGHFYRNPIGI